MVLWKKQLNLVMPATDCPLCLKKSRRAYFHALRLYFFAVIKSFENKFCICQFQAGKEALWLFV